MQRKFLIVNFCLFIHDRLYSIPMLRKQISHCLVVCLYDLKARGNNTSLEFQDTIPTVIINVSHLFRKSRILAAFCHGFFNQFVHSLVLCVGCSSCSLVAYPPGRILFQKPDIIWLVANSILG